MVQACPSEAQIEFCKDYEWADCWELEVPRENEMTSYDWAQAIFSGNSSPKVLVALMRARHFLIKPFNVDGKYGVERVGSFPLLGRTENETILGKNDKHLSFSVSVSRQNDSVRCTTVMKTHNVLGQIYWFFVKRGHPIIVRNAMNYAGKAKQR